MTLPVAASPVEMAPPTGLRSGAVVGMTGERQRSFLPLPYTPMEPETVSCPEVSSRTTIRRARARLHHHQMCCDVVDTLNELDAGASCKAPSSSPSNRVRLPPSSAGEPAWTWHSAASLKEEFGLQLQPGANVVLELAEQSEQPEPYMGLPADKSNAAMAARRASV